MDFCLFYESIYLWKKTPFSTTIFSFSVEVPPVPPPYVIANSISASHIIEGIRIYRSRLLNYNIKNTSNFVFQILNKSRLTDIILCNSPKIRAPFLYCSLICSKLKVRRQDHQNVAMPILLLFFLLFNFKHVESFDKTYLMQKPLTVTLTEPSSVQVFPLLRSLRYPQDVEFIKLEVIRNFA